MEPSSIAAGLTHPLAPLRADEVRRATEIAKQDQGLGPTARFVFITLREPPKAEVMAWDGDTELERLASVLIWERSEHLAYEGVVSLTDDAVVSWEPRPGVQPPIMFEEFTACEDLVKQDTRFQEALAKRGVTDMDLVMVDPWAAGYETAAEDPSRRLVRPITFVRSGPDDNGYARPVEGLIALVDLDRMEITDFEDHGVVPLPPNPGNYAPELMYTDDNVPLFDGPRTDVKPLEITQPEGPSFTIDGHHLTWQKWDLRIGFTPREGLVLHQVSYRDGDELRPVIYRASLSEMYIPYADPRPTHYRKNVFDEGEYGVGVLANQLELGCDCLGDITYVDGVVNDNDGEPVVLKNAICIHEEDDGIAWKHTDFRTEKAEVRRLRKLVISFIATVGNYEYGYYWYLYTDGTIHYEVKLSGIISSGALPVGETPTHGALVAPGLYGPHHQHFFCVRLDMAVDGMENSVYEVNSEAVPPGEDNPYGNAWVTKATLLESESAAQRTIDPLAGRYWKIANPNKRNMLGEPVAYKLMPGGNVGHFFKADSQQGRRGAFATKHLWVTPYDESQMYAGGDYPNQHPGGDGLPAYTAGDRPLENTDVVLWYVFGAHHIVRPEDWPVMPVTRIGFELKPVGFFVGNPNLDLPRPGSAHCAHHAHNGHAA